MGQMTDHPVGSIVHFKPGPKAQAEVNATVTEHDSPFLVTRDGAGKVRRVRAGSCRTV